MRSLHEQFPRPAFVLTPFVDYFFQTRVACNGLFFIFGLNHLPRRVARLRGVRAEPRIGNVLVGWFFEKRILPEHSHRPVTKIDVFEGRNVFGRD